MMISGVFLVSLLTFVCSQPTQVPYVQSMQAIEEVVKQLEEHVMSMEDEIPDITDSRRHYAVLVTHLGRVADALTSLGPMYPDVSIKEMPTSIVTGLMDVSTVIRTTKAILKKIDNHTQKIKMLKSTLCAVTIPQICNQVLDHAIKGDPVRYAKEAEVLLIAGDVAKEFLDADLVKVANEYSEEPYLINNLGELHDLVYDLSDLIKQMNDENEM